MKVIKRPFALLLCVAILAAICSFAASADVTPFRVNVSRISNTSGSDTNTGTYFVFDGQESQLADNKYSRAILAEWDSAASAYKITGSLGYESDKTVWDIQPTGFALMISAFSNGNAFDNVNFSNIGSNFSYSGTDKDNILAGSYIYLYNIDLAEGTVITSGTEGADDFTSESYVMVGSPDAAATVQPYNGEGISISKAPAPGEYNALYLSHFDPYFGLYYDSPKGDIYDECFVVVPSEYSDVDELYDDLEMYSWAFAAVLERDADGFYKVIHTAQWVDKSEWAWDYFADENDNILENRILLVCHIMNGSASEPSKDIYGSLTYSFGQLNWRAAYNGMDPAYNPNSDTEGAFTGMYASFHGVDFENHKIATAGDWGTESFVSESYVLFTDFPVESESEVSVVTTTSTSEETEPTSTSSTDSKTPTSVTTTAASSTEVGLSTATVIIIIIAAVAVIAGIAVVIIVVSKKKKKEN